MHLLGGLGGTEGTLPALCSVERVAGHKRAYEDYPPNGWWLITPNMKSCCLIW